MKHHPKNQLEPGEEVIASLQDHWIVYFKPFFVFVSGWILFFILFFLAQSLINTSLLTSYLVLFASFFILLLSHHIVFFLLIEYFVSTLIITNKRLIYVKFLPFLEDDFCYVEISEIHELEKKKHGLLKNFLNYGYVELSVPGRLEPIIFDYVRYPSRVINLIEAIRFNKDLSELDLRKTGASCSKKYKFLLE